MYRLRIGAKVSLICLLDRLNSPAHNRAMLRRGGPWIQWAVLVGVLLTSVSCSSRLSTVSRDRAGFTVIVTDSSGRRLSSVFEGIRPGVGKMVLERWVGPSCKGLGNSLARRVPELLDGLFGGVVYAQTCSPTPCTGHYFMDEWHECPPACFGWWNSPYSGEGNWDTGYQYTGGIDCLFACSTCALRSCYNP